MCDGSCGRVARLVVVIGVVKERGKMFEPSRSERKNFAMLIVIVVRVERRTFAKESRAPFPGANAVCK